MMKDRERLLARLSELLAQISRPHSCDAAIPVEVQANLWQLGVPCETNTPREDVIAQLWARKRTLQTAFMPLWGGPEATPPTAA